MFGLHDSTARLGRFTAALLLPVVFALVCSLALSGSDKNKNAKAAADQAKGPKKIDYSNIV